MNMVDEHMLELFATSMETNIDAINKGLSKLGKKEDDQPVINSIMRAFHSLKGSSALVGFSNLKEITHAAENVMVEIGKKKITVSEPIISLLFECAERIKMLHEGFVKGDKEIAVSDLIEKLAKAEKGEFIETEEVGADASPAKDNSSADKAVEQPTMVLDKESFDLFISDLEDDIERIDTGLLDLENNEQDTELQNKIMRAAHNIKGSSSMVGITSLKELTHAMENIMVDVINKKIEINRPLISLLLKCSDRVRLLKDQFIEGNITAEIIDLIAKLEEAGGNESPKKDDSISSKIEDKKTETTNPEPPKPEVQPMMDFDEETMNIYVQELEDDIDRIDKGILELENNSEDAELLNRIMRAAHNIKGSSGMVGFAKMREITHAVENVMVDIIKKNLEVSRPLISLLLKCIDRIKLLKDQFVNKQIDAEIADLIKELDDIREGKAEEDGQKVEPVAKPAVDTKKAAPVEAPKEKLENIQNVKIKVKSIEEMINQISEMVICHTQLKQINKTLKRQYVKESKFKESQQLLEIIGKIVNRLQDELMQSKMITMEVIFKNFPRMVRDLEMSLNKGINVIIENSQTRLDKSIAEEISNPLVHIIRNSADHGIELPEERKKAGKPERGTIKISSWQKSEQIIVSVEDDGAGINEEKVIKSAIKKGLIDEEKARQLTKQEAVNLIFSPGFSTAEKVSDVSGRGVGMDVVKTHIEKINGTVEIETERGKGTKITLKIPSTMSIIPCIVTEINKKMLCIPSLNVNMVLSITPDMIKQKESKDILIIDGISMPFVSLHEKFAGTPEEHRGNYYTVVLGLVEKRVAVRVDRLLGSQKIIVKPLGNYLDKVKDIAGTTILEDGNIAFVLDVVDIVSDTSML